VEKPEYRNALIRTMSRLFIQMISRCSSTKHHK